MEIISLVGSKLAANCHKCILRRSCNCSFQILLNNGLATTEFVLVRISLNADFAVRIPFGVFVQIHLSSSTLDHFGMLRIAYTDKSSKTCFNKLMSQSDLSGFIKWATDHESLGTSSFFGWGLKAGRSGTQRSSHTRMFSPEPTSLQAPL